MGAVQQVQQVAQGKAVTLSRVPTLSVCWCLRWVGCESPCCSVGAAQLAGVCGAGFISRLRSLPPAFATCQPAVQLSKKRKGKWRRQQLWAASRADCCSVCGAWVVQVPYGLDDSQIPDEWECKDNVWDPSFSSCDVEQQLSDDAIDEILALQVWNCRSLCGGGTG